MKKQMPTINYSRILKQELIPALGCTEPLSLAFAAAKARDVLGHMPDRIIVRCSGNVVKNVHGVVIPGTKNQKGVELSVTLGAISGNSHKRLEVLTGITSKDISEALCFINEGFCEVQLAKVPESLYIQIVAYHEGCNVSVTIVDDHVNIVEIRRDEEIIYAKPVSEQKKNLEKMSFDSIFTYATDVPDEEIILLLDQQIVHNLKIAEEGLAGNWGSNIGKLYLNEHRNSVSSLAISYAAAACDARMSGCALPVVINSGSGNQGLTVSLPIIVYANYLNVNQEKLYQALILGNLLSIYVGFEIGKLSAYCGAVSAASASAASVAYLYHESKEIIEETFTNSLVSISGILCDGAKPSCAMKISTSLGAALLSYKLAKSKFSFKSGDGIKNTNTDDTVNFIGEIARKGMHNADKLITKNLMVNTEKGKFISNSQYGK